MKSEEYIRLRKMFLFGIVVSLVTVFGGEIPIGWVVNPETDNEIFSMILGYDKTEKNVLVNYWKKCR